MSAAGRQVQGSLFLPPRSPRRLGPAPSPPVIGRHLPGGRGWLGGGQDRAGQGRASGWVAAPLQGHSPGWGRGLGRVPAGRRSGAGRVPGEIQTGSGRVWGRAGAGPVSQVRVRAGPGEQSGVRAGLWFRQERGLESGQDRAGSGPLRGSGPHCDGLAPASAPEEARAAAGRPGRVQGHSDQEVGILLLGVCLGNSGSLDRVEQRQIVKELEE